MLGRCLVFVIPKAQVPRGITTYKQKIQLILALHLLTQCWQQESEQADFVFFPRD